MMVNTLFYVNLFLIEKICIVTWVASAHFQLCDSDLVGLKMLENEALYEQKVPVTQNETPPLSKNALKRQLKRKKWEDSKKERKALHKAKLKAKKEALKLRGERLPKKKRKTIEGQEESGVRVVIDCEFDDLMVDKVVIPSQSILYFDK